MRAIVAAVVAGTLLVGGCASDSPTSEAASPAATTTPSAAPTASNTATPTPTPTGPIELAEQEAGELFLTATCPVYSSSERFNEALEANGELAKVSGPPESGTRRAARTASRKMEKGAEMLTDDAYLWPKAVTKEVKRVAQIYYENASSMNRIAARGFTWDQWSDGEWASPKVDVAAVRLELGLGAAPKGC